MRDITTNWNNSAYNSQTVFVDYATGNTVTVPANTPVNVRSMYDSVGAGTYQVNPGAIAASEETLATAPEDESEVTVTVTLGDAYVADTPVKAVSSAPAKATVSPALAWTATDGTATFTITSVADGEATITFTAGTRTDTTVVTVTDPD